MRKFMPYISGIAGLVIGFAIGAAWILRLHTSMQWNQSSTSTSIAANLAVTSLRNIRSGATNEAIERLEHQLDKAVIRLGDICQECPRPESERFPFKALARAKAYRDNFPRKTESAATDRLVASALTLADETKKP